MFGEPQKEHEWLMQLVGDWTYEGECDMGPDQPRDHSTGRESVEALGPFWVIAKGEGSMPGGGQAQMRMTIGFQPGKGYVGSWIGSMMPLLWVYEGTMSEDGRSLHLAADGPSFKDDGGIVRYEDIVTVVGPDERLLTSRARQEDGSWKEFLWMRYTRV
ncbi:DUF1579 domain-containing protein [Bosea sp. 117]|uniref:DUF1579 domain-containing protein n=1 Tax=Bosea sp. 117 TaxID=1125973 RepID=UPI0004948D7E|nr:DUF1579 domain-containing protein [Bosea sp. 117]